jgi:hypothetical protein
MPEQSVELAIIVMNPRMFSVVGVKRFDDLKRIRLPGRHSPCPPPPLALWTQAVEIRMGKVRVADGLWDIVPKSRIRIRSSGWNQMPQNEKHSFHDQNTRTGTIWDEKVKEERRHSITKTCRPAAEKRRRKSSVQYLASRIEMKGDNKFLSEPVAQ